MHNQCPGKPRKPLTNNSTGLQLWKLQAPVNLFTSHGSILLIFGGDKRFATPAQRAAAVSLLLPLFADA
ncbi:hypothetical protein CH063_15487 [Colletotrichum higginsianum]|uniref:Uncharacterized protein n=1 Tax=Colletotrichum higginsianum (strain IMI 349063) TaxID=759273 RepID=H1W321_COLHI|nr:hypothetical protein CH063_15487 [Colletotrichum higginsianum]